MFIPTEALPCNKMEKKVCIVCDSFGCCPDDEQHTYEEGCLCFQGQPIQVWAWEHAPQWLRDLSPHGGDEDWVALLPKNYAGRCILWLEGGSFGCCDISEHPLPDGRVVRIGAHA